ncbi:hypothetical protein KRM28CT15_40300 [Krasilnikovia sp. M28-CT-15]
MPNHGSSSMTHGLPTPLERDWPPRDDEAPRAQYLTEAEFGPACHPEYAGLWRLPESSDGWSARAGRDGVR